MKQQFRKLGMFAVAAAISTGSAYAGKPAMQPMTREFDIRIK